MTSLTEHYQQAIEDNTIVADDEQLEHLAVFERLRQHLRHKHQVNPVSRSLLKWFGKGRHKGIYIYGSVGVGKSYLMDLFYDHLEIEQKKRIHYHALMQYLHHELKTHQGQRDPLVKIAKSFARQYWLLCIDEFVVTEIADAMLLSGLIHELIKQGVILVCTSNTEPAELYRNGLQRTRFLPAIDCIERHMDILAVGSTKDYRLASLKQFGTYVQVPDSQTGRGILSKAFDTLVHSQLHEDACIEINQRPIQTVKYSTDIVWFSFDALCQIPRSRIDYIEICNQYEIVMVEHLVHIAAHQENLISNFISLVDILYDSATKAIISAAVPIEGIYTSGRHVQAFARTQSRLYEMSEESYLHEAHHRLV